jgi:hypothetical protein
MDYLGLSLFPRKGPTVRHVSRGGRPASALPHDGMPAYESETGALLVMENLVVFPGGPEHPPMALPTSYMMVCVRTQGDGLTALHDDPAAIWSWRPLLYSLGWAQTQRMGSQQELEYRRGLWEVEAWKADVEEAGLAFITGQVMELRRRYGRVPPITRDLGDGRRTTGWRLPKNARKRLHRAYQAWFDGQKLTTLPYAEANERAERLLRENLAPQQLLDLDRRGGFFVRGTINRLYFVDVGNGFGIVDPVSHEQKVSLCLHPDEWIPHHDVALATKLGIDGGKETEAELLGAARPRVTPTSGKPLPEERAAYRLEERFRFYP